MPDEQPPQAPPQDPFAPGHSGNVMILANYHGLRAAGGRPVESALLVAAYLVLGRMAAGEDGIPHD